VKQGEEQKTPRNRQSCYWQL